jgi:hypothetical protein
MLRSSGRKDDIGLQEFGEAGIEASLGFGGAAA